MLNRIWNKIKQIFHYYEVRDISSFNDFRSFDEFEEEANLLMHTLGDHNHESKNINLTEQDLEKLQVIGDFLKSSIFKNVSLNEKNNVLTIDINGVVIEIDDRKNIHVKNMNMMILDYQYAFLGDNQGKTKAELLNAAIASVRLAEKEIEENNKSQREKQKRELPFLDTENMIIPEYRISDTGLLEAVQAEINHQCSKQRKKTSFWIGLNRITVEN